MDRVARVSGGELLSVPRHELVGRDGNDSALSEGREAMEPQTRFIAFVGARREVVDGHAVLLILQPLVCDFGKLRWPLRRSGGSCADLDGEFVAAAPCFHQTDPAESLPARLSLPRWGRARVVRAVGAGEAVFDSGLL